MIIVYVYDISDYYGQTRELSDGTPLFKNRKMEVIIWLLVVVPYGRKE